MGFPVKIADLSSQRGTRFLHVLGVARRDGYECYALSFDYGQRHRIELEAAARVAKCFRVARASHREDRSARFRRQRAHRDDIDVPEGSLRAHMGQGIPITYVPARNTIFLSSRWPGPKCSDAPTFSSASMRSIIPAIPIAVPNSSPLSRRMANLATKAGVEGRTASTHPHAARRS